MGTERRCDMRRGGQYENAACCEVREKLRAVDFALVETSLYLDAYPDCAEALAYYRQLLAERHVLVQNYTQTCGPLTVCDDVSQNGWQWVKAPWPWEPEAN